MNSGVTLTKPYHWGLTHPGLTLVGLTCLLLTVGLTPVSLQAAAVTAFFVSNENTASFDQYNGAGAFVASFVPTTPFVIPYGTVADASGNLYVSDVGASRIVKFSPQGQQLAVLQTPHDATGLSPEGLAFDTQGNLYVTSYNGNILRFDNATGSAAIIGSVPGARTGIVFSPADNLLYITTSTNGGNIYTLPISGGAATLWAQAPGGAFPGSNLRGLALFGDDLYLADATWDGHGSIFRFHAGSNTPQLLVSGLCGADYVQTDSSGNIYVAEYCANQISRFAPDGSPLGVAVSGLSGPGSFTLVETAETPEPPTFSVFAVGLIFFLSGLRLRGYRTSAAIRP